jgi:glycosyltransferase involved in cell wall biosynthesis/ubiquinone/menaquinone biosynthesis C-methylase UbiE
VKAVGTSVGSEARSFNTIKERVRAHYDGVASTRDSWYRRGSYYHDHLERTLQSIIPAGSSVLELGCGTGNLLAAIRPSRGLGLDLSPEIVKVARRNHPQLAFEVGDAEDFEAPAADFDFVVASDLVGELEDIAAMLERVRAASNEHTRLVLTFHNPALEEVLRVAQRLGLSMAPARQNWVGRLTMTTLLDLADYHVEKVDHSLLVPISVPVISGAANRHLSGRRAFSYIDLVNVVVARAMVPRPQPEALSVTVLIPCRNEIDNIEPAVERTPELGSHTEILFVDGSSTDGTKERIEEVIERYRGVRDIRLLLQVADADYAGPKDDPDAPTVMLKLGKGDAVRKGFDVATGDVLMILDADLTVPPEDLPRFLDPIAKGKADFVNGTRLVYPMEDRAMKFVNYLGNWFFSVLFTWLLEQPIRDTLCGTKVLRKRDYERIKAGRAHFGEFDPFGDFDLLFGASRCGLRIVEVPVRYRRRMAGVSKVRVSQHGWLLIWMSFIGLRRLKFDKWMGRGGIRRPTARPPS